MLLVRVLGLANHVQLRGLLPGVLHYPAFTDRKGTPGFIALIRGAYTVSRHMAIRVEGPLGAFVRQWLVRAH